MDDALLLHRIWKTPPSPSSSSSSWFSLLLQQNMLWVCGVVASTLSQPSKKELEWLSLSVCFFFSCSKTYFYAFFVVVLLQSASWFRSIVSYDNVNTPKTHSEQKKKEFTYFWQWWWENIVSLQRAWTEDYFSYPPYRKRDTHQKPANTRKKINVQERRDMWTKYCFRRLYETINSKLLQCELLSSALVFFSPLWSSTLIPHAVAAVRSAGSSLLSMSSFRSISISPLLANTQHRI